MTTPPVVSVTDELIAELEAVAHTGKGAFMIECAEVHAITTVLRCLREDLLRLLSERAELKRDAERYRWLRAQGFATIKPEPDRLTLFTVASQHVEAENLDAAIDTAMQS